MAPPWPPPPTLAGTLFAASEGEVQLYNWGNYASSDLLGESEDKIGVKVTVTDSDSKDDAFATVEAWGARV